MVVSNTLSENESPHDYRIKLESPELELVKERNIKSVLEVFSGDGRNIVYFAKQGMTVTGIEDNDKLISDSNELVKKNKASVKLIKHPVFMKKFPFPDNEFDFVYSYQYLNHNFKDQIEEAFKEIFRVLKPNGLFSIKITDYEQFNVEKVDDFFYRECDPEFPQIMYRKLAEQTFAKLEGDEVWIPHYCFNKDELVRSLEKAGFKLVNIRKIRWNLVGNFTKKTTKHL
ncbi:class I SAM-dependent methyltransferase [Candidatus Woesearchaeota archaeon]|nr:class I SAM-dependent methyltransferase [Candidatus Woesearchaeota archaeon]